MIIYSPRPIKTIYAVEVSGACNLEDRCTWCPMHNRPRYRKRGLMNDEVVNRSLYYVSKLPKHWPLMLHVFGEPLLHPKFDEIAKRFSEVTEVCFSTNAVLLDEKWADRLAKIKWAWISLSPWDKPSVERATVLLNERKIPIMYPEGVSHNWAGQAKEGPQVSLFKSCAFLNEQKASIRWDGFIASCCISDRPEDAIGHVNDEPEKILMRSYSLCDTCHHAV